LEPAAPFSHATLFSEHFLDQRIQEVPGWAALEGAATRARKKIAEAYDKVRDDLPFMNEAQTENEFIRPVLSILGFPFTPQVPAGRDVPDYLLWPSEEAKSIGYGQILHGDYSGVVAVCEAKYWDRPLSTRVAAARGDIGGNPSTQILRYLWQTRRRWGILTNGRRWRLYALETLHAGRDPFYEVDLISSLTDAPERFLYFYALFSLDGLKPGTDGTSLVDRVYAGSVEYATDVGKRLRDQVLTAARQLCGGWLAETSKSPDRGALDVMYSNALIVLYRLLFVLFAEARALLPVDEQPSYYDLSLRKLSRDIADRVDRHQSFSNVTPALWGRLGTLVDMISAGDPALSVPAYDGDLFNTSLHPSVERNPLADKYLAVAIDELARTPDERGERRAWVDYRALSVRHLGTVYEGLLEHQLTLRPGSEPIGDRVVLKPKRDRRRGQGIYYTPDEVVQLLVAHTLEPLVRGRSKDELLQLRVLDPAMGSGHFLVASAEYLAAAVVRADLDGTDPVDLGSARRAVIEQCVFGVDVNPLAVELAKLSLWLAGAQRNRPLSFLNHHLVCGDSLLGASLADLGAVPVDELPVFHRRLDDDRAGWREALAAIEGHESENVAAIHEQEAVFATLRRTQGSLEMILDAVTAERLGLIRRGLVDGATVALAEDRDVLASLGDQLSQISYVHKDYRPLHWDVAFPGVVERAGFDAVTMNPPWISAWEMDRVDPRMRDAVKRSARVGAVLIRHWDVYVAFVLQAVALLREGGRLGVILPNPIAREKYAAKLREHLLLLGRFDVAADYGTTNMFEGVSRESVAYVWERTPAEPDHLIDLLRPTGKAGAEKVEARIPQALWSATADHLFRSDVSLDTIGWRQQILRKSIVVDDVAHVSYGAQLSSREKGGFGKAQAIAASSHGIEDPRPYFEGEDMTPFDIRARRFVEWGRREEYYGARFDSLFLSPKVAVRHLSGDDDSLVVAADTEGNFCDHGVILAVPLHFVIDDLVRGVHGSSKAVDRAAKLREQSRVSTWYDVWYIAGCLGSSLVGRFYATWAATGSLQGNYSHVYPNALRGLPLPRLAGPIVRPDVGVEELLADRTTTLQAMLKRPDGDVRSMKAGLVSFVSEELHKTGKTVRLEESNFAQWLEPRVPKRESGVAFVLPAGFQLRAGAVERLGTLLASFPVDAPTQAQFDRELKAAIHRVDETRRRHEHLRQVLDEVVEDLFGVGSPPVDL